jgi:hypothetical protein
LSEAEQALMIATTEAKNEMLAYDQQVAESKIQTKPKIPKR